MLRRLLDLPLTAPRSVAAALILLTLAAAPFAARLQVDPAVETLLPAADPERAFYRTATARFGSEEVVVVALFAEDVFAPAVMRRIAALTRALEHLPGVREVLSPTTVRGVEATPEGVRVGRFVQHLPRTAEDSASLRSRFLEEPLYVGTVVSRDGRAAALTVSLEDASAERLGALHFGKRLEELVERWAGPLPHAITGLPILKLRAAERMQADVSRFLPVGLVLVLAILAWSFRELIGVLVPLFAVVTGVLWTLAAMHLAGERITMGTVVLAPLLLAVGTAYAVYVWSRFQRERAAEQVDPVGALRATMRGVGLPLAVAIATTMLGFSTFLWNPIPAIRQFGRYASLGLAAHGVVMFLGLPALAAVAARRSRFRRRNLHVRLRRGLDGIARAVTARRRTFTAVLLALGVVGVAGTARVRTETDFLRFFPPCSPEFRANRAVGEALGGAQPLYVTVDGPGPGALKRVEAVRGLAALEEFLGKQPGVAGTLSLVDFLTAVRRVLQPDTPRDAPFTQAEIDQLLLFVDAADLRGVVTRDFAHGNILVRTDLTSSRQVLDLAERVERLTARGDGLFPADYRVRVTGMAVLLARSAHVLVEQQIRGLGQMLVALALLMSALFLSVRIGVLSLVPNIVPIVLLFGLMGWTGIPLDMSTSMVAAMALGLAIDDTIHFLAGVNEEIRRTGSQPRSVRRALRTLGQPMVFTTTALAAGFSVACLSGFLPVRYFGVLAAATMGLALLSDLVLTPTLLLSVRIITLWDLLFVRLGDDPVGEIPLFHGLRPLQAKIVVLMAHLARARPGTVLARRGELREELYVLISGVAEVRVGDTVIRQVRRGDVIGEMGLIRRRPRSADVIAVSQVEYLVLDAAFLRRIRRYPRIAATVFLNLSRILSDRLESTTDRLVGAGV